MQAKVSRIVIACIVGLFGMTFASAIAIDKVGFSAHGAQHHYRRAAPVASPMQLEEYNKQMLGKELPQTSGGPVYRCHDPAPELFGPAPPVEDCNDVIKQFSALTTDIHVKLVEGCYQIVSGNCTGLVCPQRVGESTIPGAVAAQYMASPLRDECIAKGQRGWWNDGQGWGIGVYLT